LTATVALSLFCALWVVACGGTTATTSRADVAAVSAAERGLDISWRQANAVTMRRCERGRDRKEAKACLRRLGPPREEAAAGRFTAAIKKVLANGVGEECKEALEQALENSGEVPFYPGETAAACRAEIDRSR
jgi:hypothetical protein